jgi:hypothetical protein
LHALQRALNNHGPYPLTQFDNDDDLLLSSGWWVSVPEFNRAMKSGADYVFVRQISMDLFGLMPEFPNQSWLSLPAHRRTEVLFWHDKLLDDIKAIWDVQIERNPPPKEWSSWRLTQLSLRGPRTVTGWLVIPMGLTRREILSQFSGFLEEVANDDPDFFVIRSNTLGMRGGPQDALRQLAAMRLLDEFGSPKDAATYSAEHCRDKLPLYTKSHSCGVPR